MMQAKETLFLEVFINDYRIGKLASFHRYADGCLTIASEDLREFDLKVPNEAIHDGGICLERMPGVTYRYDAAGQTIHFAVTDEVRVPLVLDARRRRPEMAPAQEYPVSAVFNYALFANANSDDLKTTPSYQGVSATVDMHLFSGYGAIDQSATMNSTASELTPNAVRLDSRWSYEDPAKILTYVAGDIVSASLNWTRSVRMGGVQLRRDFTLRPDLITSPLPQVSGSAAVPSTIELYANQSRALSKEFAGGPFTIDNIPTITVVRSLGQRVQRRYRSTAFGIVRDHGLGRAAVRAGSTQPRRLSGSGLRDGAKQQPFLQGYRHRHQRSPL
jgi:outer membrane usher protein